MGTSSRHRQRNLETLHGHLPQLCQPQTRRRRRTGRQDPMLTFARQAQGFQAPFELARGSDHPHQGRGHEHHTGP